MRRASAVTLVAAVVAAAAPVPAQAATASDLAARARAAAELARESARSPAPERMDEVRAALGLPDVVTAGGWSVRLPEDPFLESLDGESSSDFHDAARHLEALADAVDAAAAAVATDEASLRADLAEAYGGIEEEGFMERLWRAVVAFFRSLFQETGERPVGPGVGWLLLLGLLAVAVVLVRLLRIRPVPEAAAPPGRSTVTPADWRRRAQEARAHGDLSEAVIHLYRALVATLDRRGVLEDRPSLTAGDVRRAARGLPPVLAEAATRYERVRYGRLPGTEDDLAVLLEATRRAA